MPHIAPHHRTIVVLVIALAAAGCHQPMRPSDVHLRTEPTAASPGPIPLPVPVTASLPRPRPSLKPETYSVVVNQVPVQQLLFALARDAKMNVDVHPGIGGNVTMNAIDQTLAQLLTRIAKQVDMRWELDGPNLAVMPDSPYLRTYKVDYVNIERTATGQVSVSSQIAGQSGGGGGGSAGAITSTLVIRNTSSHRFWDTLVKNVEEILRETDKLLPTGPPAAAPKPAAPNADPNAAAATAPPAPTLLFREASSVISNPESGVLFIRATARQHEKLQEFLDQVLANARRQVLIEATIVEVELSNQYQQGIDWTILRNGIAGGLTRGLTGGQIGAIPGTQQPNVFSLGFNSQRISVGVRLLESFGNVRVLSSPRLSVLNNQTAALRVVRNLVYFTITAQPGAITSGVIQQAIATATPQTLPVGLIMNLTPQISDQGSIILNLKPTLRRQVGEVADPSPTLGIGASRIQNLIPVVEERELESVMRLQNGEVGVMGGLIEDSRADNEAFIPGANRIPIVGNVFGNRNLLSGKRELVVFLRPVLVSDPGLEGDYRGYRVMMPGDDFMSRPHPSRREIDIGGRPR